MTPQPQVELLGVAVADGRVPPEAGPALTTMKPGPMSTAELVALVNQVNPAPADAVGGDASAQGSPLMCDWRWALASRDFQQRSFTLEEQRACFAPMTSSRSSSITCTGRVPSGGRRPSGCGKASSLDDGTTARPPDWPRIAAR